MSSQSNVLRVSATCVLLCSLTACSVGTGDHKSLNVDVDSTSGETSSQVDSASIIEDSVVTTSDSVGQDVFTDVQGDADGPTDSIPTNDSVAVGPTDTGGYFDTTPPDTGSVDTASADVVSGPPSCVGKCGNYEENATCQCDEDCQLYGDCCSDFEAICTCKSSSDCSKSGDVCGVSECIAGFCMPSGKLIAKCDDGDPCTYDVCDKVTGACTNPAQPDGSQCSDADCVQDAKCWSGKCKILKYWPEGFLCNNSDKCQLGYKCKSKKCTPTKFVSCDDNQACTIDLCHPQKGCIHDEKKLVGTICKDAQPCFGPGKCDKFGWCTFEKSPTGTKCSDGDPCTIDDACDLMKGCLGKHKSCSDGDPCTKDACDTATGACDFAKSACDDGINCTTDTCEPSAGGTPTCKNTPIPEGGSCDDGHPCHSGAICKWGVCSGGKNICNPLFSDYVACGSKNWVFDPAVPEGKVGWNADATPKFPTPTSGICSLNFNNGKNYEKLYSLNTKAKSSGTATLATPVALPTSSTPVLSFWSFHGVEMSYTLDARTVLVSTGDFAMKGKTKAWKLDNMVNYGKWHLESFDLSSFKGEKVRVRFHFKTVTPKKNDTAGWFVDDVVISTPK